MNISGHHSTTKKRLAGMTLFMHLFFLLCVILSPASGRKCHAAEDWRRDLDYEERMRIAELIRDLDAAYSIRRPVVDRLTALGSGEDHHLVESQLIDALDLTNPQIREGAIETMTRIGAPTYAAAMVQILPYENFLDNRLLILRVLPTFTIRNESTRREVVDNFFSDNYAMNDRVRSVLRSPPLRPSGREMDAAASRVRRRVIAAVAGQLDPVGTLLEGYDSQRWNGISRQMVETLLRNRLDGNRQEALERWHYIRPVAKYRNLSFIAATQQRASRVLADMGALEAWEDIIKLGQIDRPEARESALLSLAELTRFAHRRWGENMMAINGAQIAEASIISWPAFLRSFVNGAHWEGGVQVLWERLPDDLRRRLTIAAGFGATTQPLSLDERAKLLDTLNRLLQDPALFNINHIPEEKVSGEIRELLQRRAEELSAEHILHLNRLILEILLPTGLRRHTTWHQASQPEKAWRREEIKLCRNTAGATFLLAKDVLSQDPIPGQESVRRAAYRALGSSRHQDGVDILERYALRLEPTARLRVDIAWALGEIGGLEAVNILAQLAVYKGHTATSHERQDEYRGVCAAIKALGAIAGRPGDRGARLALEELIRTLADTRTIQELSSLPTFSEQALHEIQLALNEGGSNLTAEEWRQRQKDALQIAPVHDRFTIPLEDMAPEATPQTEAE